jgi:hypothetical protein
VHYYAGTVVEMIQCRTIPRTGEMVYAALVAMSLLVGGTIVVLAGIYGPIPLVVVGLVFVLVGIQQYYLLLMHTASELSLNPGTGQLSWRATRRHGDLATSEIEQVTRSTRPRVYQFICVDGSKVPFWLSGPSLEVCSFFDHLQSENPDIVVSDLYRRQGVWWRGLSAP